MGKRLSTILTIVSPFVLLPVAAAYVQWGVLGLPALPPGPATTPETVMGPYGFPAWLRITHYVNFLFLILLIRSGLQILMDHPRLYWNVHCTPNTEWVRFTPIEVPTDRVWNAKDDARPLSPWVGLPGYRHSIGMARHWHFLSVLFWVGNGVVFVVLLFGTEQWKRLVPTSWRVLPDAWAVFVHYATFHLPPESDGFYRYNALQQLAYFSAVFVLAPLGDPDRAIDVTRRDKPVPVVPKAAREPANRPVAPLSHNVRFRRLHLRPRDHGRPHRVRPEHEPHRDGHGRCPADRSVRGFDRNCRGRGAERTRQLGGVEAPAGRSARRQGDGHAGHAAPSRQRRPEGGVRPRGHLTLFLAERQGAHLRRMEVTGRRRSQGLPVAGVRPRGKPCRAVARRPPGDGQEDPDHAPPLHPGLVGNRRMGGLTTAALLDLVRPKPDARVAIFYSFGEGLEGGHFYDSHTIENLMHPQSLLAYEMNFEPLNEQHGTPLRLRVENQLGFKMVKWIRAIEFVGSVE